MTVLDFAFRTLDILPALDILSSSKKWTVFFTKTYNMCGGDTY